MHVVTFYSFKGGVGRSMALANVAYALAKAGRRVLAVDFDLEAPGLCSYASFKQATDRPGIVEFVHHYLKTDQAPPFEDFVTECEFGNAKLWMMPAGRHLQPEYSGMLNEIDWRLLYEERDGFLLMEDLREQWRLFEGRGFDYVLIDSRTGHTDVGGICTRHLPDAVNILFVPTPQNIDGLAPIVAAIAAEPSSVREHPIKLHFCPSNVPDLDDDEAILADLLQDAKTKLGYSKPAAVIQHYRSLDLLLQPVVTQSNPGSRLAKQFEELRRSLIAENLEDREGALLSLDRAKREFAAARNANDRNSIDKITSRVGQIRSLWPNDGEIAWSRAEFANDRVRPEEEVEALNVAIAAGVQPGRARLHRAYALSAVGEHAAALDDVKEILVRDASTVFEIIPALQLSRSLAPDQYLHLVRSGLSNGRIRMDGKAALMTELMTSREGQVEVVEIGRTIEAVTPDSGDRKLLSKVMVLAFIGLGLFQEALDCIGEDRETILTKASIDVVFNYAVAEWGRTKTVPVDLLKRVLELRPESCDANSLQCMAVCSSAVGNHTQARVDLEAAEQKISPTDNIFSCWRYLEMDGSTFLSDIREMKALTAREQLLELPLLRHDQGILQV